jgi:hypothetical protein
MMTAFERIETRWRLDGDGQDRYLHSKVNLFHLNVLLDGKVYSVCVCADHHHINAPSRLFGLSLSLIVMLSSNHYFVVYKVNAMCVYIPCGLILEPEDMALGGGDGRVL